MNKIRRHYNIGSSTLYRRRNATSSRRWYHFDNRVDVFTTSDRRCCRDVETRRRHDVEITSTNKSDSFTTSDHRRCLDIETQRRDHVDITSTTKSGVPHCINVETRRRLGFDMTSTTKSVEMRRHHEVGISWTHRSDAVPTSGGRR